MGISVFFVMNCQVCKVFILFLITCNSLNSAESFVGQAKDTVDVFGGNYDYDDHDQDYNDEDHFEEIDLHENSLENLINDDVDQGNGPRFRSASTSSRKRRVNSFRTFYDEF